MGAYGIWNEDGEAPPRPSPAAREREPPARTGSAPLDGWDKTTDLRQFVSTTSVSAAIWGFAALGRDADVTTRGKLSRGSVGQCGTLLPLMFTTYGKSKSYRRRDLGGQSWQPPCD